MRQVLWSDPSFLAEIFNAVAAEKLSLRRSILSFMRARSRPAARRSCAATSRACAILLFELIGNRMNLGTSRPGGCGAPATIMR